MVGRFLKFISLGLLLVLASTGCQNDGFKASQKSPVQKVLIEEGKPALASSPRVLAVAEAAKQSSLKMELDALSVRDAEIIMSAEVQRAADGNSVVRAIIKSYGMVAEFSGDIRTNKESDGQALVISDFRIDKVLVAATRDSVAPAARTFQVISHCANSCNDLFIHIQINNHGEFESGAFYNFKRGESSEYEIVNSSVEASYKSLEQVRELLKTN